MTHPARASDDPEAFSAELPFYEPPAVLFEQVIEAVANTCNFDPPLTKASVAEGCTGLTFS